MTYFPFFRHTWILACNNKIIQLLTDAQRLANLQIELAAVVDCGESFVKATYNVKGDGAVVFNCYKILDVLSKGVQTAHFPNLYAVARKLSTTQPTPGGSATIP